MEDEQTQVEDCDCEPITVKPQGVPEWLALVLLIVAVCGWACWFSAYQYPSVRAASPGGSESLERARLDAQKAQKVQTDFNSKAMQRQMDLQLDVSKRCADRGLIPVFMGGNIDCKAAPK